MREGPSEIPQNGKNSLDRAQDNEILWREKQNIVYAEVDRIDEMLDRNSAEMEPIEASYVDAQKEKDNARESDSLIQEGNELYRKLKELEEPVKAGPVSKETYAVYSQAFEDWRTFYAAKYKPTISRYDDDFIAQWGVIKEKINQARDERIKMYDRRRELWGSLKPDGENPRENNWDIGRNEEYNHSVNAFLDTVRDYQEKRLEQKRAGLFGNLKKLGVEGNQEILSRAEKIFQNTVQRSEAVMLRSRAWAKAFALWTAAVGLGALAMHSTEETKVADYVSSKVDSVYSAISSEHRTPEDSVANEYLQWMAQSKEIPIDFRVFISKEDSDEFDVFYTRQDFVLGRHGEVDRQTENERKITYLALEEMNRKYGHPKVTYGSWDKDHDRAYYTNGDSVIHVPTYAGKFKIEDYIAELSHSKQYSEDKDRYTKWHNADYDKTQDEATKKGISYHDAQLERYHDDTSLEHEAHSIIQPQLEKELEQRKKVIRDHLLGK